MQLHQNPKLVNPECDYCHRKVSPKELVRFLWKQKKVKLDLCPRCYRQLWDKHLRDIQIPMDTIMRTGYWEQGAREVDFKSYLEKWARRLEEQL